jgi:hypothetical protein
VTAARSDLESDDDFGGEVFPDAVQHAVRVDDGLGFQAGTRLLQRGFGGVPG